MNAQVIALPRPGASLLTDADRDLIRMLADGWSLKRIGRHYGLSAVAIGNRLSRLYARTGTNNSAHLVATALRCGWLDDGALEVAA